MSRHPAPNLVSISFIICYSRLNNLAENNFNPVWELVFIDNLISIFSRRILFDFCLLKNQTFIGIQEKNNHWDTESEDRVAPGGGRHVDPPHSAKRKKNFFFKPRKTCFSLQNIITFVIYLMLLQCFIHH